MVTVETPGFPAVTVTLLAATLNALANTVKVSEPLEGTKLESPE